MIHQTPPPERPRERCLKQGANCLSLRECLAILLNTGPRGLGCLGLAARILTRPGDGLDPDDEERAFFTAMEVSGSGHLSGIPGLGPAQQSRLLVAFEVGRRYALFREKNLCRSSPKRSGKKREPSVLLDPRQIALSRIDRRWRAEVQEWLGFVPTYPSGKVGSFCWVEKGVRTHVNVEPAELFARILALRPSGFYLFHNHPSGNLIPSDADEDLTEQVAALSRRLGIQLLGHGIVAPSGEEWIDLPAKGW